MLSKKNFVPVFGVAVLIIALNISADASITEIRRNFFQRTADLPATAFMSGPTGTDASYLIAIYESSTAAAVPTLRWTDENGVAQARTTSCVAACQLLAFIRVKAGTDPTVETSGYSGSSAYSLYVSGIGFWSDGTQEQGGLSEVTGFAVTDKLIYAATGSISGLLVAYSESSAGQQYVDWWDEDGERSTPIAFESPVVMPIRIAGGTGIRIYDITQKNTHVWYGLILFGLPSSGAGPFIDYEYNMLDWTNASYPNFETVFTNGDKPATLLVAANVAEQPNSGTVEEAFGMTGLGGFSPLTCPNGLVAPPSGNPAGCASPFTIQANTSLQVRTVNQSGTPWGHSPAYSAEIDILKF